MCAKQIERDINVLRDAVAHHEYLFYILGKPWLPDRDFDIFKAKLTQLENEHPEYRCVGSPTQRYVNFQEPEFKETKHVKPLLSFMQGTDLSIVNTFVRNLRVGTTSDKLHFVIEPKIHGVDVELVYERGIFTRAVLTRDGFYGIDVTQNIRALKQTPLKLRDHAIPAPPILAIHAILYLTEQEFYEYNFMQADNGDRPFFTHKSLIEHVLLQHDTYITTGAPLKMVCVDTTCGDWDLDMVTYPEIREALTEWGFLINPIITESRNAAMQARTFRDNLLKLDFPLPYEIDGAVVKVVETSVRDELGISMATSPWGADLLFPPIEKAARVSEIAYRVDQRGIIIAEAIFNEVYFKGVDVERAEFKRVEDVVNWDVRPGDMIRLERDKQNRTIVASRRVRRQDITPEPGRRPKQPIFCPTCREKLTYVRNVLRCTNKFKCKAQLLMRMLYFIGRDGFNIRFLGPGRIQAMLEREIIHDVADLFTLKWQDIADLPRVGEKNARKIIQEIRRSRKIKLRSFLFALHIQEVGHVISAELERVFHTLHGIESAPIQALLRLRAVGPMAAQSIYLYFKNNENIALIEKLLENGVRPYNPNMTGRRRMLFQGQRVLLVGSLRKYRRKELKELIEVEGGTVTTNHRFRSDLVIHGKGVEEKLRVQREFGVLVWGEARFLRYLQEFGVG